MVIIQILLFTVVSFGANSAQEWNYNDTSQWGTDYPACNGNQQSPIALYLSEARLQRRQPLKFRYYNVQLNAPLNLTNNGETAKMTITNTTKGFEPQIYDPTDKMTYYAKQLHFHWGSRDMKGSEHRINGLRYDVEMHVVHQTVAGDKALVLAIMLQAVDAIPAQIDRVYPGLSAIFKTLPNIIEYGSTSNITSRRPLTMASFLGDLRVLTFYSYAGSLTTPPCTENVNWYVFPNALNVPLQSIEHFWNLQQEDGSKLTNNFRPIQDTNNRTVYFRLNTNKNNPIFFAFPKPQLLI